MVAPMSVLSAALTTSKTCVVGKHRWSSVNQKGGLEIRVNKTGSPDRYALNVVSLVTPPFALDIGKVKDGV